MTQIKYTGRVFICTSLNEEINLSWACNFSINKVYYEMYSDNDNENLCCNETLLLMSNEGMPMYVDKSNFLFVSSFSLLQLN